MKIDVTPGPISQQPMAASYLNVSSVFGIRRMLNVRIAVDTIPQLIKDSSMRIEQTDYSPKKNEISRVSQAGRRWFFWVILMLELLAQDGSFA